MWLDSGIDFAKWIDLELIGKFRTNWKVFNYYNQKASSRCKNWQFIFTEHMNKINLSNLINSNIHMSSKMFCNKVEDDTMDGHINVWRTCITSPSGSRGNGRNKLRAY